jgi:hypothetical protein
MRIVLDIERLVLDGLSVTGAEASRIRGAVEGELSRLLRTGPLPARFLAGGSVPGLIAPPLGPAPGRSPRALGAEIARATHRAIVKVE